MQKEQSVRSLGREYTSELSDRQMGKLVQKQLREGIEKIDNRLLPGKLKVWCYQFTLLQWVMWPLKVSVIPSSLASRMDTISNTYIRKWLGLQHCFSDTGLFGKNALQLPLKSINLGYKQEKTRLVFELKESRGKAVKTAWVTTHTGRRWRAQQEVDQATVYNTRRLWEESNTAEQGWAGESQSSFGPKSQVSRGSPWWWKRSHEWNRTVTSSRLFPSTNKEHGPPGRTSLQGHNLGRYLANSTVVAQLPHEGSV